MFVCFREFCICSCRSIANVLSLNIAGNGGSHRHLQSKGREDGNAIMRQQLLQVHPGPPGRKVRTEAKIRGSRGKSSPTGHGVAQDKSGSCTHSKQRQCTDTKGQQNTEQELTHSSPPSPAVGTVAGRGDRQEVGEAWPLGHWPAWHRILRARSWLPEDPWHSVLVSYQQEPNSTLSKLSQLRGRWALVTSQHPEDSQESSL